MKLIELNKQKCSKCHEFKNREEFYSANNKRGTMAACKKCKKKESALHRNKLDVKLSISKLNREWRKRNADHKLKYDRSWRKNNKDKYTETIKKWEKVNYEHLLKYRREYRLNRLKLDINFKLACNLRSRLNKAISRDQKSGSAVKDLGCSIEQLKVHLESQFQEGMTWDNYGEHWEIDHIKPLASFDLTNESEFKEACHYTNLQPLTLTENRIKGCK